MPKEYAPGLPTKADYGDISKVRPGQLLDYVIQKHEAKRRGTHYDFRIGNKRMGMFSWALNQPLPEHEKERIHAPQTELHEHGYNTFQGEIPSGYGAGKVSTHDIGKALVTNVTDKTISFSIASKKHPARYTLVKPYEDSRVWIMMKQQTPEQPGAEKLHYKAIPKEKLEDALKKLKPGSEVQAKIDGALHFLNINGGKAELLSHRYSKITGKPVIQTERFFGKVPHLDIPKELKNSVVLTEVYGERHGKAIPNQELSGILNSSTAKALETQKREGIELKGMLFDVAKRQGDKIDILKVPYAERKKLLEQFVKTLPKGKFTLPESAHTPEEAKKLLAHIQSGKHPYTVEGVVVHPPHGTPLKYKIMPEADVWIRDFFPPEKGSKYENKAVGGFTYSHTRTGPVVGRVGTGLSDSLRTMMKEHPDWFKDRLARIHSHGKFEKTTAHRVPAFLGIHEDYPSPMTGPGAEYMREKVELIKRQ